jgi:PadR family transcriptional regulator AphA
MSLKYALLGLLRGEPMNGYAIKTLFDEAINFVWQANLSQIYRELGILEKEGLVRSSIEQQSDRPNKRMYAITGPGRKSLDEWLETVPEEFAMPKRDEFTLKLFFGSLAGEKVVEKQLESFLRQMRAMNEAFHEPVSIAARHPNDPLMARADRACREDRYCRFIKMRARMTSETIIRWAEACLDELKAVKNGEGEGR